MTHWLYPANIKYYDVLGALSESDTYWPVHSKVIPGDCIFFYLAAPYKRIMFKCEVLDIDLMQSEVLSSISRFFKGPPPVKPTSRNFMKIMTKENYPLDGEVQLVLSELKDHGLKGMLMGARKLENAPELLAYILDTAHGL